MLDTKLKAIAERLKEIGFPGPTEVNNPAHLKVCLKEFTDNERILIWDKRPRQSVYGMHAPETPASYIKRPLKVG